VLARLHDLVPLMIVERDGLGYPERPPTESA
jgi:hypothetical protein